MRNTLRGWANAVDSEYLQQPKETSKNSATVNLFLSSILILCFSWRFQLTKRKFDVQKALKEWLADAERVVVAGIGNPIRSDDFVGVKIVQNIQGKISERVYLIECETVPESFLQPIVEFNPTHVLLIDAAILGLKPGETRLIDPERIADFPAISTHMLPLRIFCEYLTATTKAKIALLLIEPKNVEFGEGLTPDVQAAAEKIANILLKLFS
jgi:hydrogenase 3 maturation protease